MKNVRRYWFEFSDSKVYSPLNFRCGITAFDKDDAVSILETKVLSVAGKLTIARCIEDVDVAALDKKHVLINLGNPVLRGFWFPFGY
ncbi:MAG TPA: hypothetical protein VMR06_03755 [Dokdonella sp.]|uniref:hypothetical protein n=1 Tax=Dokdonella sp. TaxID=2291710 RepID=UPI002B887657|nr:hypothetical protein [Dokdonella sp.]HUD41093.1 hypothetical protein [Dokdonella sp.]